MSIRIKRYRVEVWFEEGGNAYIDATSPEKAEQEVQRLLEENGVKSLDYDSVFDDYGINNVEEVEKS